MNFEEEILLLIKSKYPLIWIQSYDEEYVSNRIFEIAKKNNFRYYSWSITKGLCDVFSGECLYDSKDTLKMLKNLNDLIKNIKTAYSCCLFLLYDFDKYFDNPTYLRYFKDAIEKIKGTAHTVILLSASYKEIKDFYSYVAFISAGYPDEKEILSILNEEIFTIKKSLTDVKINISSDEVKKIIKVLKGLTSQQIRSIINRCIIEDNVFDVSDISKIEKYKKEIYDREGILEYYPRESAENIGGFGNLKKWVNDRKKAFLNNALNLPLPKGILILGVPGSGKSLAAKVIANILELPLYKLDIGRLYSKFIGETEENLRKAFNVIDKLSPVCIWVDEIEKLFSMSNSDADGGLSARILGLFLTWMQERKNSSFIIATANDVMKIPPELLRKGRFDEVFFSDLPDAITREDIFKIHLKKRNINFNDETIKNLVGKTIGFTGAEIEQVIISAVYSSPDGRVEISDIEEQIKNATVLSRIRAEEINALRIWAVEKKLVYV